MKIFDLHCDTATVLYRKNLSFDNPITQINAAATEGHALTQCFAVFFPDRTETDEAFSLLEGVKEKVFPQFETENLRPILTAEGAGVLAGRPDWVRRLKELDCRMAGLVWNGTNSLATGAMTDDRAPLSEAGIRAVKELTQVGITVDVSHLSAAGTDGILSLTDAPVVASHSNARRVCNHPRNLTDEAATEIFRRGGLVGLNLYPPFLSEDRATIRDAVRHAEHLLTLGGQTGLALGCDLDGVEILPEGIGGFSDLPILFRAFQEAFGTERAEGIFYRNAARFFGLE